MDGENKEFRPLSHILHGSSLAFTDLLTKMKDSNCSDSNATSIISWKVFKFYPRNNEVLLTIIYLMFLTLITCFIYFVFLPLKIFTRIVRLNYSVPSVPLELFHFRPCSWFGFFCLVNQKRKNGLSHWDVYCKWLTSVQHFKVNLLLYNAHQIFHFSTKKTKHHKNLCIT